MLDSSQEVRDELSAATESDRTPTYHAESQNVFKSKISVKSRNELDKRSLQVGYKSQSVQQFAAKQKSQHSSMQHLMDLSEMLSSERDLGKKDAYISVI